MVTQDAKPYDFLKPYLTGDNIEKIAQETNRYAQHYITANADNLQRRSMVRHTNANEIQAFLGLYIVMALMYTASV